MTAAGFDVANTELAAVTHHMVGDPAAHQLVEEALEEIQRGEAPAPTSPSWEYAQREIDALQVAPAPSPNPGAKRPRPAPLNITRVRDVFGPFATCLINNAGTIITEEFPEEDDSREKILSTIYRTNLTWMGQAGADRVRLDAAMNAMARTLVEVAKDRVARESKKKELLAQLFALDDQEKHIDGQWEQCKVQCTQVGATRKAVKEQKARLDAELRTLL